jgi:hypothetical protein
MVPDVEILIRILNKLYPAFTGDRRVVSLLVEGNPVTRRSLSVHRNSIVA